jgi:hypothetical protein
MEHLLLFVAPDCTPVGLEFLLVRQRLELDEVPAVGDPPDLVQIRSGCRVFPGERQRRVASNDA